MTHPHPCPRRLLARARWRLEQLTQLHAAHPSPLLDALIEREAARVAALEKAA